jgi:hypothetical protein
MPTVAQCAWYRPGAGESIPHVAGAPLAAVICAVHPDGAVNLVVFDSIGGRHARVMVPFAAGERARASAAASRAGYAEPA